MGYVVVTALTVVLQLYIYGTADQCSSFRDTSRGIDNLSLTGSFEFIVLYLWQAVITRAVCVCAINLIVGSELVGDCEYLQGMYCEQAEQCFSIIIVLQKLC